VLGASVGAEGRTAIIIDELRGIQRQHGYLPAEALRDLADRLSIPLYHVQGVASFFPHFRLAPPPAVDVRVCADMSCHLRGADRVYRGLQARLSQRGMDGVVVRPASCLGQCDRAPAAALNDTMLGHLTSASLAAHVETALRGGHVTDTEPATSEGPLAVEPYRGERPYGALRDLVTSGDTDGLLAMVKASGLRGLGGAGFPTATKWEHVRHARGAVKYVVCNADESEPGTIKDRFLMDRVPHLIVEGMILAAMAVGARSGIIYIRHEYAPQIESIRAELERCGREGLIGPDVLGSGIPFELTVFVSPGGYICGEETALYEVLQGNRAEPRNKPPHSAQRGLWYRPTLMNNVETFAMVPLIARRGPEWFRAQGRGESPGVKFVGISGHVTAPGVYEIAMGTPVRELLERAGGVLGGQRLKAFAPSGPSSGYLPPSLIDTPLDFSHLTAVGSMLGSGAVVICGEETCMLDMALNAVRFFRNESCGKCVPCRVGTVKLTDILEGIAGGRGRREDLELIADLSHAMAETSICGLGQIAPAPIRSVIRHFPEEIEAHVVDRQCPADVCPMTE
jgi:NADH:ubiquinone oxidoreductase subunit F (NADH-binding)/NADH:ubiquinone oxidoreductase subunit E